jgi:filamentous hemagglutinin
MQAHFPAKERQLLSQLDGLSSTNAQGTLREIVSDSYFQRNGYVSLNGKCGSGNCFDGVYLKGNQLVVNEVKPVAADGSITLNPASGKLPQQMTDSWIQNRANELLQGTAEQQAVGQKIWEAIRGQNGMSLVKMVTGVDSKGMTIIKLQ